MGLFISMEGPDGSGKTLQMDLLEKALREMGYPVHRTREPGGTPLAEKIRQMLLDPENKSMTSRCEALLYAASRAQHVEEVIVPALEAGKIVLSDRFVDSSLVYQGIGRGLGMDAIAAVNAFGTGGVEPDVTILVQIDYEEGLRRKNIQYSGKLDRIEQEADSFHRKVHDAFNNLAQRDPERVRAVDGQQSVDEVHAQVMKVLEPYLRRYSEDLH